MNVCVKVPIAFQWAEKKKEQAIYCVTWLFFFFLLQHTRTAPGRFANVWYRRCIEWYLLVKSTTGILHESSSQMLRRDYIYSIRIKYIPKPHCHLLCISFVLSLMGAVDKSRIIIRKPSLNVICVFCGKKEDLLSPGGKKYNCSQSSHRSEVNSHFDSIC